MCCYKCALVLLFYNALVAFLVALEWGMRGTLNFEAGFLGFFLILLAGYKKLKGTLQNAQNIFVEDKPKSKFTHFTLGMQASMGLSKLGAYALLLILLFVLMDFKVFMPLAYLLGLGACLVGVLGLQVLKVRRK